MLRFIGLAAVAAVATTAGVAFGDHDGPRPLKDDARWTTVFKPPAGVGIEGLTADRRGDLYTPGRGVVPCPVFRIRGGASAVVGNLPGTCNPAGLAFGPDGRLYVADSGRIMVLRPNADAPPTATVFAEGVPGSNGVAFDRRGDLWVSDGGTGQGRVWRIGRDGVPHGGLPRPADRQRRGARRDRPRRARPAAGDDHDHRRRTSGLEPARLPAPGGQRHRVRRRRQAVRRRHRARRDLAGAPRPPRPRPEPDRLRHDVHAEHAVPGRDHGPAPVPRGRRRDRARRRREHLRLGQRAQLDRGRDRRGPRGRVLPQPGAGRHAAAQRRARSSSRPARCSWAASCARRTRTAPGATTSPLEPGEGAKVNCVG